MVDQDKKDQIKRKRQRNQHARALRENKAFAPKRINPKRNGPYKRQKIDIRKDVDSYEER